MEAPQRQNGICHSSVTLQPPQPTRLLVSELCQSSLIRGWREPHPPPWVTSPVWSSSRLSIKPHRWKARRCEVPGAMQVEESTHYFEGCKWISKAGLSLLLTSGDESTHFSQHISSEAIRSFLFKKKMQCVPPHHLCSSPVAEHFNQLFLCFKDFSLDLQLVGVELQWVIRESVIKRTKGRWNMALII